MAAEAIGPPLGRLELGEPQTYCVRPGPVIPPATARFDASFESHHRAVLAYALRRVQTEADAEDAVAETFAVAWRRIDRLPEAGAALPWLLAIARRVIANQHRGAARRLRLGLRLRAQPQQAPMSHPIRTRAVEALAQLRSDDQELLRLLAWDGLSQTEAGAVLGITANAVAIRLYRARRRFAEEFALLEAGDVKGSDATRTSDQAEGKMPGRRSHEEQAP